MCPEVVEIDLGSREHWVRRPKRAVEPAPVRDNNGATAGSGPLAGGQRHAVGGDGEHV